MVPGLEQWLLKRLVSGAHGLRLSSLLRVKCRGLNDLNKVLGASIVWLQKGYNGTVFP